MARDGFEIGIVYRNNGRYFLAVTPKLLVGCKSGDFYEVRPYAQASYIAQRELDVATLCNSWGTTLEIIDEKISRVYFLPENPRDSIPSSRVSSNYVPWVYKSVL